MELRHLRYFVLVAEELHFGRAAERAGIAQPPLSQQIRSLEAELGVRLFHRTNRRVELTASGRALLPKARALLGDAQHAAESARAASSGYHGTLTAGFVGSLAIGWLPQFARALGRELPDVQLGLRELTSEQQREALHSRRIDLGLVRYPINDQSLESELLGTEPLVAALPDSSNLASSPGPMTLDNLADSPIIMFPRRYGPDLFDQVMAMFRTAGVSPRIGQEAVQMVTIVALVSAEIGVAIVPKSMQQLQMPGVAFRPIVEADGHNPQAELYLVRSVGAQSGIVEQAVKIMRAIYTGSHNH